MEAFQGFLQVDRHRQYVLWNSSNRLRTDRKNRYFRLSPLVLILFWNALTLTVTSGSGLPLLRVMALWED